MNLLKKISNDLNGTGNKNRTWLALLLRGRCSPKTIGMNKYLEPLFKHLKKCSKKGVVGLTYAQIEELIGKNLVMVRKRLIISGHNLVSNALCLNMELSLDI